LPNPKLLKNSKELNIWSHYLAQTSVGRKIPEVGDRGTPGYRREWQLLPRQLKNGFAGYITDRISDIVIIGLSNLYESSSG
jgi:hypothetical protein